MSTPSRLIEPSTRAPGVSSCMRLSVRRKVDLPQPDGPMIAVTARGGMVRLTPLTARNAPYQTSRPSITIWPSDAWDAPCCGACVASSGSRTAVSTLTSSTLADPLAPGPRQDHHIADAPDEQPRPGG